MYAFAYIDVEQADVTSSIVDNWLGSSRDLAGGKRMRCE